MNCYYLYKGIWYSEQSMLNLLKNGELKDVYSRGVANIPSLTKAVSSERVEKVEQIKEKQDGINGDERTEEVQGEQLQLGEKPEDQVTETGEKTAEEGAAEEVGESGYIADTAKILGNIASFTKSTKISDAGFKSLVDGYVSRGMSIDDAFKKASDIASKKRNTDAVSEIVDNNISTVSVGDTKLRRVFIRFGEPRKSDSGGYMPSSAYAGSKEGQKQEGISVFEAGYDPITGKYVIITNEASGLSLMGLIGQKRDIYLVEGDELVARGEDFEPQINPETYRSIKKLSIEDVVDDNETEDVDLRKITPSVVASEAYHEAKKSGNNPTLVKAIENLLKQPTAVTEPLSQPEGQIVQPEEKVAETGEKTPTNEQYLKDNGYFVTESENPFTKETYYKVLDKNEREISFNKDRGVAIENAVSEIKKAKEEETWSDLPLNEFIDKVKQKYNLKGGVSRTTATGLIKSYGIKSADKVLKGIMYSTKNISVPTSGFGRTAKNVYLYKTSDVLEAVYNEINATKPRVENAPKVEKEPTKVAEIAKEEPKVSKKAARQKRFEEIDIELGNELENLAESLGIVKKLTGEQRAKLLPTVIKVSKLLAEKYALKGEELIDEIVEYFRGKNIELDEEILKEVRDAEEVGKGTKETVQEEGTAEGEVRRIRVRDDAKDGVETGEGEKVRQFGKKVSESTILSPDLKKNVVDRGIGYLPRGRKITEAEARELIRIYDELGGMDRVKAEIMSPDFRVNGDTRIAMATIYVNDRIAKSKTETDHIKAEQYKTDAADILEFYVNRSTGVAQELEGMKMWNKVIGTHPDFIAETVRSTVAKQNAEFYDTYSNDIAAAKKIIDDFINSKDFKEKYAPKKETPAARKQRGMNKIASGIDKLATLRGIRFQAVPESDMPTSEYEALKEIASGILDVGIASVEELIAELKTQTRRYFSPSEIDKVSRRIVNDIDAKNNLKKKTVKIKLDKTDEEQLIDKLFKSMVFATRKQLKQLVADNIELLQEKGLIDDRSFRELIAKAVGRYYVSEKQIQSVEKAAKVINDAKNIEKNIDNLFDDYMKATEEKNKPEIQRLKKEVDRQLKEYKKAMLEAGIASSEIGSVFADSPTLVKMFATFIQGNLLTPASLKVNLLANLLVSPVRLARNSMAVGLDMLLSEVGSIAKERLQKVRDPYWREVLGKMLSEERTFTSTALNAGLVRGFASGTKEGIVQMWKGQAQDDITNRDVSKALKPLMAWYDLYQAATGKEKLRMNEVVQKFVEGTFGIPPEIMFRFLNLGDKPFRRAAEQARLDELAGIKKKGIIKDFLTRVATDNGLEGDALKEFVKNPDKESLKDAEDYFEAWKTKFMIRPDEESWEQARKAGLEAVYQQDNVLSNALKGIQKATTVKTGIDTLDKIISSISRFVFVANIPFVKTPTNVMIETLEYAVPVIPFARAMLFDAPKGDRRAFVKNMSKAIVGTSINTAVGALFGLGVMGLAQGGGDDEPKERVSTEVKAAEYYYRPPYYTNTRAMADLWSNIVYGTDKDLSWKEGDTMQQYTRYGLPSAILMAHAQGYAGMKPEEIKQLGLWDRQLLFTMPALKAGLDQSYVKNISALINALKGDEYEQESYLVGLAKATEASVLPNSYRAYQQAKDNYIRETRMATLQGKERIVKSIANDFATSYNIGKMPPPRVSIWGEDVERYQDGKSPLFRIFDISKERTYGNGFGIELFNLYTKTQNNDVLPPDVPNRIKVLDDYVKVDGELYHDLVQYSAGKHKMVVSAIMNSDAWKQLPNDAAKVEFISDVYKGKVNGIDIPTRSDFTREFVSAHRDQFIELYKKQHGVERYEKLKRGTE